MNKITNTPTPQEIISKINEIVESTPLIKNHEVIPDNSNINTYTTVGTYYVQNTTHASTMSNVPFNSGFIMYVIRTVDSLDSYKVQAALSWRGIIKTRYTSDSGSTWSDWSEVSEGTGTTDYNDLINKPQIEGVTLSGNKSFSDLNANRITNTEIENIIEGV